MTTKDGFSWTKKDGLCPGVPCIGAIQPETNITSTDDTEYDVIVVGAGYAGLTAARDMSVAGLKVLLLEARDRIGGRSWSSNLDGYPYEMGGTWVHWGQPTVWREIARYGMQDDLESSHDFSRGINRFLLANADGSTQSFTHEEEDALMQTCLAKLFNVDGNHARDALSMPHSAHLSASDRAHDQVSVADRLVQIQADLTPTERACLEAFVLLCSGATLATTSFYEMLHWWALSGHSYAGCVDRLVRFKLRGGQSSLALRFFDEAAASGNLAYALNEPVAAVRDKTPAAVQVTTRSGKRFVARRMVCTLPLNVLRDVEFAPELDKGKREAVAKGHVNQTVKVHAEIGNRELRSWTGISYPHNGLIYGLGDGETPRGSTHVVAFGGQHKHFHPEDDIERTIAEFNGFTQMDVQRVVFHNWSRDEFAKGAWFFPAPGLLASHFEELRARQGNVFFASSDWASGWRSFIDGAIEEGTRAAAAVRADLLGRLKI